MLLSARGLLRRPSLSGTPPVTFCSVHIHNVVAERRDASTELLRRLHGYMQQHNVDFTVGDFNISAFSTVGDGHLAILSCGDSARWRKRIVSALGFSSCRSDHMSGVWIHMAATSSTMQTWHLDHATPRLTFPSSFTCAPPNYLAPTALRAVNKPNKRRLERNATRHERRKRRCG